MMKRRNLLKSMLLLPLAASNNMLGNLKLDTEELSSPFIAKITKVRAILTAPYRTNLVIVKVETDQPGLYGVGCATFTQRAQTVASAITEYLDDFGKGKNTANIEDIWQTA
ncbi:MAG: hypothetical protein KAR07_01925 [Spirochaetes bacterium]|nr:hypothetical protein [Spirochaetota bacterium]